jgi:hypothetical protein
LISFSAVLSPTPGMPGTLSMLSPISVWISTASRGVKPYFSSSRAGSITSFVYASYIRVQSSTTCRRSLSDETMNTS